jgi:hypothetical protein
MHTIPPTSMTSNNNSAPFGPFLALPTTVAAKRAYRAPLSIIITTTSYRFPSASFQPA